MIIEDVNVGEEVCNMSDAVYSNDFDTAKIAIDVLKTFHTKAKDIHETTHYPSETEE